MAGKPLSIQMYRALYAVRMTPARNGSAYPGGWPTIDALRRRHLVLVTEGGIVTPTLTGERLHLHSFSTTMHMDGCHWYSWSASCKCGATYSTYDERDLKSDPYSAIWMDNEDPEAAACLRCEDLMAGARPIHRAQITEPKAVAA